MKKLLSILAIIAISFQYAFSQDIENDNDSVFTIVDVKPEFKGGEKELWKFLGDNINYPIKAQEWGASYKISVRFTIFKNGTIGGVEVVETKKLDYVNLYTERENADYQEAVETLKEESIRLVKLMDGKWIPAQKDGENVDYGFTMPITFRIVDGTYKRAKKSKR